MSKSAKRTGRFLKSLVRCAAVAAVAVGLGIATPHSASANSKYSGIVVDTKTGKTLYSYKADTPRYPASLTKIMTLYVLFEELEAGRFGLNSQLKITKTSAAKPPSKLGLKPGSSIRVKDAILALVTKSANDIAAAIAENVSGSEAAFARRMTATARRIGMKDTTFRNASGLPDSRQKTTARDMAILGRAIQERFPKYYGYFDTRVFTYNGRRYGNHNRLLGAVRGVDGIKTGYIRASGFNLVTSVKRDNREIVAVVMGGRTGASRNAQMKKLIGQYLPKASTGPDRSDVLVASAQRGPAFHAASLEDAPIPGLKPDLDGGPLVTGTVPVPAKATAVAAYAPERRTAIALPEAKAEVSARDRIINSPLFGHGNVKPARKVAQVKKVKTFAIVPGRPFPSPAKTAESEQVEVASAEPVAMGDADIDEDGTVTVASNNSADPEPGWQVQIAAAETEDLAISMLKRAKGKAGRALRGIDPYTEPVESAGSTLYRARFVGFTSKSEAWGACKALKRAKYDCYAIYE
ncbi:D-alanyl-D-alanine carboxypeptidase [Stappia sediminis]|uniref:D-alanyl-D-alanine carboxypeptidase n=1 Tax=Stappia sediminis TaxID=2692190 RepID=UPI001FCCA609|nr:D-alanyl-D-alanine carboxypeptidase [Stappia sediminis]